MRSDRGGREPRASHYRTGRRHTPPGAERRRCSRLRHLHQNPAPPRSDSSLLALRNSSGRPGGGPGGTCSGAGTPAQTGIEKYWKLSSGTWGSYLQPSAVVEQQREDNQKDTGSSQENFQDIKGSEKNCLPLQQQIHLLSVPGSFSPSFSVVLMI